MTLQELTIKVSIARCKRLIDALWDKRHWPKVASLISRLEDRMQRLSEVK